MPARFELSSVCDSGRRLVLPLAGAGVVNNIVLKPQQKAVVLSARIPRSEDWDARIASSGIHSLAYVPGGELYQVKVPDREALETHTDLIKGLVDRAKPWA